MCLRYQKTITDIPRYCSCGEKNSIDHVLMCKKGGYVSIRHNQIRDLEAKLLSEVCKDVTIEPHLIPLSGEVFPRSTNISQEARLDVSARGVWNAMDKTLLDIRVFHPGSPSNAMLSVPGMFKKHEDEKKRTYNRRVIEVEKATFTPLVFSTSGGMGKKQWPFIRD